MIDPNCLLPKRMTCTVWALTPNPPHECPCGCQRTVRPDPYAPRKKYYSDGCRMKARVARREKGKERERFAG